jgi:hypothetical protein
MSDKVKESPTMNSESESQGHVVTQDEANEQQVLPYDQNLAKMREEEAGQTKPKPPEPKLSDSPMDENLVNDDIIEEGQHTT